MAGGAEAAILAGQGLMTYASIKNAKNGMNMEIEQLRLRQEEERLFAIENTKQQADALTSALSTQLAMSTARGMSSDSGSLGALQTESLKNFQDDEFSNNMNYKVKKQALGAEMVGARQNYRAAKINGVMNMLGSSSTYMRSRPTPDTEKSTKKGETGSGSAGGSASGGKGSSGVFNNLNVNRKR